MVVIDGYIGNDPEFRTPARLYIEAANANIAGDAAAALLRPPTTTTHEPELTVIYTPNLKAEGYPGRPPDRRRPRARRHARLQLGLLRRVEEGRPAHVEQARLRPRRPAAARRLQGHPDPPRTPRRPDRRPLRHGQDDDDLHAPERLAAGAGRLRRAGCPTAGSWRPRTAASPRRSGSIPTTSRRSTARSRSPTRTSRTSPSTATRSTSSTRATRRTAARPSRSASSSQAPTSEIDEAHFLLILNRNENIIPAVAKLEGPQAAAFFMLGETQGTSAGGADEAGKFLRVPGTNPFFPMPHDLQGNRFLELLEEHPLEVYLMNTGRVGGAEEDERSKKVRIQHSSAIVKGIAEGTIEWERGSRLRLHGRRVGAGHRRRRTSTSSSRSASTRRPAARRSATRASSSASRTRAPSSCRSSRASPTRSSTRSASRLAAGERGRRARIPFCVRPRTRRALSGRARTSPRRRAAPTASTSRSSPRGCEPRDGSLEDVDAATLSAYTAELGAARPGRDPRKLAPIDDRPQARGRPRAAALHARRGTRPRRPARRRDARAAFPMRRRPRRSTLSSTQLPGDEPLALRNRALLELVYSAGLRSREAVDLDLGDVDFEQEAVHVRGKGGKERVVPLGEEAAYWLSPLPERGAAGARARRRGRAVPLGARPAARHEHDPAPPPPSAPAAPCVRDAPARGRRRPARDPGAARPQLALDDADLQPRRRAAASARSMTEPIPTILRSRRSSPSRGAARAADGRGVPARPRRRSAAGSAARRPRRRARSSSATSPSCAPRDSPPRRSPAGSPRRARSSAIAS